VLTGCDSPAQIVEINPQRGALEVRTNLPIQIRFDRAVDRQSVVDRFRLQPATPGQVRWKNSNTFVFEHGPLAIDTDYSVILDSGFRDQLGVSSQFRHSWRFRTEGAPQLTVSSPANREKGVDPAAYLTIVFNREMNGDSFHGAISITPPVRYQVRLDPLDAHRVVIAPRALLDPATEYSVEVTADARDADGNHVRAAHFGFSTGEVKTLQHWVTFIATEAGAPGAGIWMVDENRFPRLLADLPVDRFTLSPGGSALLLRHPEGGWALLNPGAAATELPFDGEWAAYLGPALGFLYLSGDSLDRLRPDQTVEHVASEVGEVAVAPDLARIAFTIRGAAGGEIDGYDLSLRARYVLLRENQPISKLAWSPSGLRLAYVLSGALNSQDQLRVKSLSGTGLVTTVAMAEIDQPTWLADSNYVTFSARIDLGTRLGWRVFRVNASLPPARLTPQLALGGSLDADATSPRPSPDGHQIAFLSGPPEGAQIWLMNADGTGLQRLTGYDAGSFPFSCRSLHWAGF